MSDSVGPHRQQPTRLPRPWDSPGKNTGVGCHFLLQCMKVKSESEVAQSCLTLSDPMDCSLPGSSTLGFSRQEYWSGVPSPSPNLLFGWREITIQCCVGFCHTAVQMSHNFTDFPSLLSLPPLPPSHPSSSSQSAILGSLCYIATSNQLSILYMVMYIC